MDTICTELDPFFQRSPSQHTQSGWRRCLNVICVFLLAITTLNAAHAATQNSPTIRVAIGDIPGLDMLILEIAAARTSARGTPVQISYLQSESLATQAVIEELADVGVGTPYALIQNSKAPLKLFYQLQTLRFFPVVDTRYMTSWKDLDGKPMYTHGQGSGTEAIMLFMAKQHGIRYGKMHYVPGSGVRADALIKGRIHATIVDTERRNMLLAHPKGHFATLPLAQINATDEALFSRNDFIEQNPAALQVLVEELVKVTRQVAQSPESVVQLCQSQQILPRIIKGKETDIITMYQELASVNALPQQGGYPDAARDDLSFYHASGTLNGSLKALNPEQFWELTPLSQALQVLDGKTPD